MLEMTLATEMAYRKNFIYALSNVNACLKKVPGSAEFAHAIAPDRVGASKRKRLIAWQVSHTACVASMGDKDHRQRLASAILLFV